MVFSKFAAAVVASVAITSTSAAVVDQSVHRALQSNELVNLIVEVEKPIGTLQSVQQNTYNTRAEKIEAVVKTLKDRSDTTQGSLDAALTQHNDKFVTSKRFWISNAHFIEGATEELVEKIAAVPGVVSVREEKKLPLIDNEFTKTDLNSSRRLQASNVEWGIAAINAPDVWNSGNTGEGIVVSHIDTGVHYTHEALKDNYRSDHGWYDPYRGRSTPYDNHGHGTHTMGTIAGSKGIGVAPGSTWITCKGCDTEDCSESALLACGEFITCPTDAQGNNEDCSKAPHLVSNSWGGGQGDTWYGDIVEAWHTAGIIPVFAMGNEGPECRTAGSPGDMANVIGVGATTKSSDIASFSSKGPTVTGLMKPDISAPGKDVVSAYYQSDNLYASSSGTSMATPHVAGGVALMLAQGGDLPYGTVVSVLTATTETNLGSSGYTCGGISDSRFPNNIYGYGLMDVKAAVESL